MNSFGVKRAHKKTKKQKQKQKTKQKKKLLLVLQVAVQWTIKTRLQNLFSSVKRMLS